jgi:uncharacterized protein with FMN-binding domain
MHRGLVALSASAVAAIYLAGYVRTQAADASIAAATVPTLTAPVAAAAPAATPSPIVQPRQAVPTASTGVSAAGTQTQATATYKDGTFTGQGTSRRGDVWVSVQIQAGRIAGVTITRSTLQYPLGDIAKLPGEVVQRQSAQVDIVSRATYSSMAFRGAVSQALSAAQSA